MPIDMWSMVEEKCGIIFASGPAIRQFVAYYRRVGTVLPSRRRQIPGGDFVEMRYRITFRDLFWYRRSGSNLGTNEPHTRLFRNGDRIALPDMLPTDPSKSRLDIEEGKVKRLFSFKLPERMRMPSSLFSWASRTKGSSRGEPFKSYPEAATLSSNSERSDGLWVRREPFGRVWTGAHQIQVDGFPAR